MNLSRNLILNFEHKGAADWLRKARVWGERHNPRSLWMFPEFGWLALYEGALKDAAVPLKLHLVNTHADAVAASWLALACVIGEYGQDAEMQVCRSFMASDDWNPTTTIAALAMALTGKSQASTDLRRVAIQAFSKCRTTEVTPLSEAMGIKDLSVPSLTSILPELVRMLDSAITGGRNREMV